jgi:hypothetical protein
MAFYQKNQRPRAEGQIWSDENKTIRVAPAKIDEMLLEALEAFEQARRLHQNTPNPETKRQAKLILDNLHASLLKLAPLGVHSAGRLERLPVI